MPDVPTMPRSSTGGAADTGAEPIVATVSGKPREPGTPTSKVHKKPVAIESFEQLVTALCTKKGNRPRLSAKVQQRLAAHVRPSDESIQQLLALAQRDQELAVPRNLLLMAREVVGYPALRGTLRDFARRCLLQHPLFLAPELVASINNTAGSPSITEAFAALMSAPAALVSAIDSGAKKPNAKEARRRRLKAAQSLALWFVESRGVAVVALCDALFRSLWEPAAARLRDDSAQLDALTKGDDILALGLACAAFQTRAVDAVRRFDSAEARLTEAREEADGLRRDLEALTGEVAALQQALADARDAQSAAAATHQGELAHLRAATEEQRTRILRRLRSDLSLLEEALIALRREPPKVQVMDDYAERVIEALRGEIKILETER